MMRIHEMFVISLVLALLSVQLAETEGFQQVGNDHTQRQVRSSADYNFIFTVVEVVARSKDPTGKEVHLEAFKSKENDQIWLQAASDPNKVGLLRFLTVGFPTIVVPEQYLTGADKLRIPAFEPDSEGFHFSLRMLQSYYYDDLASRANNMYKSAVKITREQFDLLTADNFTCAVKFTSREGPNATVVGKVNSFQTDPLKVSFELATDSPVYEELKSGNRASHKIKINCEITKQAQHAQNDQLMITSEQIDKLSLKTMLFGNASSVFVSRHQLSMLGREVLLKLNIFESYESGVGFETNVVSDFLENFHVANAFTPRPIAEVLSNLSPYNIKPDLSADEIIRNYSDVLKVETIGDKKRIFANRNSNQLKKESSIKSGDNSLSGSAGAFKLEVAAKFVDSKSDEWANSSKSVDDQVNEINRHSLSAVKFKFDGKKIVPKTLDVAQISDSAMSQSMKFSRIRRKLTSALFRRQFELSLPRTAAEYVPSKKNRCPGWLYRRCQESSDCCEWDNSGFKLIQSCGEFQPNRTFCNCVAPGDRCYGGFRCCDGSFCDSACPLAGKFHYCNTEVTPNCQWGLTCTVDSISKLIWPSEFEGRGRCLAAE